MIIGGTIIPNIVENILWWNDHTVSTVPISDTWY